MPQEILQKFCASQLRSLDKTHGCRVRNAFRRLALNRFAHRAEHRVLPTALHLRSEGRWLPPSESLARAQVLPNHRKSASQCRCRASLFRCSSSLARRCRETRQLSQRPFYIRRDANMFESRQMHNPRLRSSPCRIEIKVRGPCGGGSNNRLDNRKN